MEAPERDHNPDMELMKSRIESAGNIGTLKVSLVATLAVFNEHFTNIKARLAKLEKTVAANTKEEKRKSDKKKLNKNDIGGPQVGTFVHVAGMGMHEGEMRTIDNTEASTRDTLDPALTQFLAQAGLDPKNMSEEAIAEAKQFAEKQNLQEVVNEAKESRKSKRKNSPTVRKKKNSQLEAQLKECQDRVVELEEQVESWHHQGAELRARLARLESVLASGQPTLPANQVEEQEVIIGELEETQDMTITFEDEEQENEENKDEKDRIETPDQIQVESCVATEESIAVDKEEGKGDVEEDKTENETEQDAENP